MKKFAVKAFRIEAGHFAGTVPVPEWMKGRARLCDWDGTAGRVVIEETCGYWIVNAGDWFIFLDPGFLVTNGRLFPEFYEAIE